MANETTKVPVSTIIGDDISHTTDAGVNEGDGLTVDVKRPKPKVEGEKTKEGKDAVPGAGDGGEEQGSEGSGDQVDDPGKQKDGEAEEAKPLEDLGEWKADDPEALAKFDGRYLKDGKLNTDLVTAEWDANKGKLNAGTKAYLADTFALSEKSIDEIAEGLDARRKEAARSNINERYRITGGGPNYERLVKWGKEKYTEPERASFNKAMVDGGEPMKAALERLMGQYVIANPGQPLGRAGGPIRRTSTPVRAVGGEGVDGGGGSKPRWNTQEDYKAEFTAAEKVYREADKRGTGKERREALEKLEALRKAGRNHKFK